MRAGRDSEERSFGTKFARFVGVRYGVPCANGSSALAAALEAINVGYGDEVLVPGLAWVACASAVARVGAVPVFVDIDDTEYAMDPVMAERLISPRTKAVLLTHLSSSVGDIDAFAQLCERHSLTLVEDCSQAHGAIWRGRRVGSFGRVAAFSFQSSKLLTAGEGGIVVTDDPQIFEAVQQLRADGRQWRDDVVSGPFPDLRGGSGWQGHNYCMTELQAAVLSCGLDLLDEQNRLRFERVLYLEKGLAALDGVRVIRRRDDPRVDLSTHWHLPVQIDPEAFGGRNAEQIRSKLSDAVDLYLEPVGAPLDRHPLYRPQQYRRFPAEHVGKLATDGVELSGATRLSSSCFTMPHHALLADKACLDAFVEQFAALQTAAQKARP